MARKTRNVFKKLWALVALAAVMASLGCQSCNAGPEDAGAGEWALDVPLGEGEVRCGPVTKSSELIGGVGAYAVVGRSFRCYNNRIRFIIQDIGDPRSTTAYGGTLIDIDLVREDETAEGEDFFREHIVAFGAMEVDAEEVIVVDDGRAGNQAVIRVTGHPAPISLAPQTVVLAQELPALIQTDFILKANSSTIEITTTLFNETDDQIWGVLYSDILFLGLASKPFTPQYGFARIPLFGTVDFLARAGLRPVSYAYLCTPPDNPLVLFSEAGAQISACDDFGIVSAEASYTRYLVVGDGTLDSVLRQAWSIREEPTEEVAGTVVEIPNGAQVLVTAFSGESLDAENALPRNQTRPDASGAFAMALPPGAWNLVAHVEGRARSNVAAVMVEAGGQAQAAELRFPEEGSLRVTTTFSNREGEGIDRGLPSKLSVLPLDGAWSPSVTLDEFDAGGLLRQVHSRDGTFDLSLPPGRYTLYVTRGFEFSRFETEVEVLAGRSVEVMANIQHVLDTEGLIASEFHQHTLGSFDGSAPIPSRVLENAAEGIEIAAATDHDVVTDFAPYVLELGLEDDLVAFAGDEISYQGVGHFNAWPWVVDPEDPTADNGVAFWFGRTVPEILSKVRENAGDPVIQNNHPRNGSFGWFASARVNPVDGTRFERPLSGNPALPATIWEDWSSDFDAIEVNDSLGRAEQYTAAFDAETAADAANRPTEIPVFMDYLAFLGAGLSVAATGSSDSHHLRDPVGYPRTFVRMDVDEVSNVTAEGMRAAVRAQRTSVGQGCLIELLVGDGRPMGLEEVVPADDLPLLRVRVQAPEHVTVEGLELYVNGRAVELVAAGEVVTVDATGELNLPLSALAMNTVVRADHLIEGIDTSGPDLVVVAVARGGAGLAPTGGGPVYCYSAPVYVDTGVMGWTGWLETTQQLR